MNKRIIARVLTRSMLTGCMLMGLLGNITMSYADDSQYVYSQTGYRLYVDEIDSKSATIKGDNSDVQDGFKITEIILPNGTETTENEVNYVVNESGEYTFKIIYQNDSNESDVQSEGMQLQNDNDEKTETTVPQLQEDDLLESEQLETENIQLPKEVINDVEQYRMENSKDSMLEKHEVQQETEEVTLTVTLLESEEKSNNDISTESSNDSYQTRINQLSEIQTFSLSQSGNTARAIGGYDYSTQKKWNTSDFSVRFTGNTNSHLDYNTNPDVSSVIWQNNVANTNDQNNGAKFRFGSRLGTSDTPSSAYWLQQGLVISDITFDFKKDFVLVGEMKVGQAYQEGEFGVTDIPVDGGVTISFLPGNQVETAKTRAKNAWSPAYRLGAYNTLANALICEYDTSSDDYYNVGDTRNFTLGEDVFQLVGDYKYAASGNAYPSLNSENIYSSSRNGHPNLGHIGISTTDGNAKTTQSESSGRVNMAGNEKAGLITYKITYSASSKQVKFETTNDYTRTTTLNISSLYNRLQSAGQLSNMKLAFTFGAAYTNLNRYLSESNYFVTGTNDPGKGQIDIYAKELYVSPDLKRTPTKVRWLNNGLDVQSDNSTYNAFTKDGSTMVYNDKSLWPVAGDRIYAQFSFKPYTNVMPQPNSISNGKLYVSVKDLKITDDSNQDISGMSLGTPKIYCKKGNNNWFECGSTDYVTLNSTDVTNGAEVYIRVELKLPKINTDITKYNVSGTVESRYEVGNSIATYSVPMMDANRNKIPVSRNPKIIDYNGQNYSSSTRIIKSGTKVLQNISNEGNKTSVSGNENSLHYGVGYQPFSTGNYFSIYQNGYDQDISSIQYSYASMNNLSSITNSANISKDKGATLTLDATTDTRYIVKYEIQDSKYSSKTESLTGNTNRGKVNGSRVIWASGNVKVQNGYEFYAKQDVTMTKDEFAGFTDSNADKASYYRKIAEKAGAKVFKTSDYDFTDLIASDKSKISGNNKHNQITDALDNPGKVSQVELKYTDSSGTTCIRTINLTIQDDTPKVVSVNGNVEDTRAEKIIFDGENYTISARFKLVDNDGSPIDTKDFEWHQVKDKIHIALYKKNSPISGGSDKFYRWANGTEADDDGKDTTPQKNPKLELPVDLTYNNDGTFTVTYTLFNNNEQSPTSNWVQKQWEDGAQWRIYAWTDTNSTSIEYDNLSNGTYDELEDNAIGTIASSTTTIRLIEKEDGNLPTAMFVISGVKLNDDGTELTDHRSTTTISLKNVDGVEDMENAEHDYYYDVSVDNADGQSDSSNRPYITLTQSDTQKTFNATYQKYDDSNKTYTDITKDNLLLGSIAYLSNKDSLPQSIRFGMRADKQNGITSNKDFIGQAHFRFVRKTLSSYQGGANP